MLGLLGRSRQPHGGRHQEGVTVVSYRGGPGARQRQRIRLGQGGGQIGQGQSELGGVIPLGRIGSGRPHQDLTQRSESLVFGQECTHAGHEGGDGGVADERGLARDAFVEHQRQSVDVGLAIEDQALYLFGGGIAGRAQDGAVGLRPCRLGQGSSQAEVGDAQAAVGIEENVGRLDVPVDQAPPVGVVESGTGFDADADRLFGGEERPGIEDLAKRATGQVLEDQVGLVALLTPVVDPQDVGVVEGSYRTGLGPEPLEEGLVAGEGGVEDLDGHLAVEGHVVGQVDVGGRTGAHGGDKSVTVAEDTSDGVSETRHGASNRSDRRRSSGGGCLGARCAARAVSIPLCRPHRSGVTTGEM